MVFFDYYDVYKFIYIHVYNVNKQDPPPKKKTSPPPFVSSTTPSHGGVRTNHELPLNVLCGSRRIDMLRTEMKRGLYVIRALLLFKC